MSAGRECAVAFKTLLELVHQIVPKPTQENKARLPIFAKEVASKVSEVVHAAEALKGQFIVITLVAQCSCCAPVVGGRPDVL